MGSNRSYKANVRIVAATNSDLEDLVKKGRFRQDLYYRINVAKLTLPPLRERKEDIPLLSEYFVSKFSRLSGKEIHGMSPEVFRILMAHDFPGTSGNWKTLSSTQPWCAESPSWESATFRIISCKIERKRRGSGMKETQASRGKTWNVRFFVMHWKGTTGTVPRLLKCWVYTTPRSGEK